MTTFFKMQGAGNDYVFFDRRLEGVAADLPALARRVSDRHFGVGGDGIVVLERSAVADVKMRMFNADGSEGATCGNALRCAGKYLFERGGLKKTVLTIETPSGVRTAFLTVGEGEALAVAVDMGMPSPPKERVLPYPDGFKRRVWSLSFGNPHAVLPAEDGDLSALAKATETLLNAADGLNVGFLTFLKRNRLFLRVVERGSGETLACGSGACAAAIVAVKCRYADKNVPISVRSAGGELTVRVTDDGVLLSGGAEYCFFGELASALEG